MSVLAVGLEDLDVCFVGDEARLSLVGSFFEVDDIAGLTPTEDDPHTDPMLEEELAWVDLSAREQRIFLGICARSSIRPLCRTAADIFDRVDEMARATLAHKYLSAALAYDEKTRARIVAQLEKLRAELEQTKAVWDAASAKADVLIGDRA